MDTIILKEGLKVNRKYKGKRLVTGTIESFDAKFVWIKLTKEYEGKNEFWDVGEIKCCSRKVLGI